MSNNDVIRELLVEIRDNQRLALQRQEEHLAIAREQIERSRGQVQESIDLQRQAIERVKTISKIAIPGIFICIVLIVYLVVRYLL
jgi:hypothetical protein